MQATGADWRRLVGRLVAIVLLVASPVCVFVCGGEGCGVASVTALLSQQLAFPHTAEIGGQSLIG